MVKLSLNRQENSSGKLLCILLVVAVGFFNKFCKGICSVVPIPSVLSPPSLCQKKSRGKAVV